MPNNEIKAFIGKHSLSPDLLSFLGHQYFAKFGNSSIKNPHNRHQDAQTLIDFATKNPTAPPSACAEQLINVFRDYKDVLGWLNTQAIKILDHYLGTNFTQYKHKDHFAGKILYDPKELAESFEKKLPNLDEQKKISNPKTLIYDSTNISSRGSSTSTSPK
ncbi:hypothetical protein L3V82_05050 [Thiotrichales bacterium 19S3-7]|nr:hypothetical protein [Thiotrichales bacterium 19S3-7]MCF6801460.1 hypothetical protein [Thiotrichales bacterium 19S3-11]